MPWSVRAPRVASQLRFNTISSSNAFIGLQEVLHGQLVDTLTELNKDCPENAPDWSYIGVGRDDGKEAGEYSPIFYRSSVWELQDWTTIWLSPMPEVPSKGWDAGSVRILTIGHFQHKQTRADIIVMNTHLDNVGTISRENSARIITEQIDKRLNSTTSRGCSPSLLLTGDFNSTPDQEAYQYLTQPSSPVLDAKSKVPFDNQYGNRFSTFTDFVGEPPKELLDHVFLDKKSAWDPKTYAILSNCFDDGVYYSDHRMVVTDVELSLAKRK